MSQENTQAPATAASPDKLPADVKTTLAVLVGAATIMILNETSLSVALPAIMAEYAVPATTVQWLLTGFMLTMAVVIPATGFAIERFTTRQVFITACLLFLTGTVVAALAPAFVFLFIGRVIQAAGTALVIPLLMTVAMTLVPRQRRGSVMGIISIVISVAPALGPTVGGAIVNSMTWHWVFWLMVPLIALILIAGWFKLKNVGENRKVPLDILSFFLSAIAFGGLIYGLSSMESMLAGEGTVAIAVAVIGAVSLVLFVMRQIKLGKENKAFLDLRPFTIRNFTLAVSVILISFGAMLGFATVLPIYLQTSLGVTALVTGLVVMPGGVFQAIMSPFVGRLFDSYGPFPLAIPGTILMLIGVGSMITLSEQSAVWMVVAMHITFSVGMAMMMTPMMTTALSSLPDNLYSHGSAGMNTVQQLAGATGTAILVVFLTRGTIAGTESGMTEAAATAQGATMAFTFAAACMLVVVCLVPFVKRVNNDPELVEVTEPVSKDEAAKA